MNLKFLHEERLRLKGIIDELKSTCESEGRLLTKDEEKRFDEALDGLKKANDQIDRFEKGDSLTALTKVGDGITPTESDLKRFTRALMDIAGGKSEIYVPFDPVKALRGEYRAVTTPAAASGADIITQGVMPAIEEQAIKSVSFLDDITILRGTRNNMRVPFLDRDNRLTPANKAFTDQLAQQAYVFTSYTLDYENYYTLVVCHSDALRDAEGGEAATMAQMMEFSRADIQRQIATDILSGSGSSNNIEGLDNYTGIQTIDATGSAITKDLLLQARQKVAEKNGDVNNLSVLVSPTSDYILQGLEDTTNQPLQMPSGLQGIKYHVSNCVTESGTTSAYVGNFDQIRLYLDAEYTVRSSERYMEYDYQAFLMVWRADMQMIDPERMVIIQNLNLS